MSSKFLLFILSSATEHKCEVAHAQFCLPKLPWIITIDTIHVTWRKTLYVSI